MFDPQSQRRIARTVVEHEQAPARPATPRHRRRPRSYVTAPSAATLPVAGGVVSSCTAATWDNAANTLTPGDLVFWPWRSPTPFAASADYSAGDRVTLTAEDHDEAEDYATGDLVVESDKVYQADAAVTAGAFDAADWTERGDDGDVLEASSNVTAGPFDAADWDDADAGLFINRSGPTVTIPHQYTEAAPAGALVKRLGQEWVVLTCEALEGWS